MLGKVLRSFSRFEFLEFQRLYLLIYFIHNYFFFPGQSVKYWYKLRTIIFLSKRTTHSCFIENKSGLDTDGKHRKLWRKLLWMCFELGITFHAWQNLEDERNIFNTLDYVPMRLCVSQTNIKIPHFKTFFKFTSIKHDWVGVNCIVGIGIYPSLTEIAESELSCYELYSKYKTIRVQNIWISSPRAPYAPCYIVSFITNFPQSLPNKVCLQ